MASVAIEFCPFSPSDNGGKDETALDFHRASLNELLGLPFQSFCHQLLSNNELHLFLDTYFTYRHRPIPNAYNDNKKTLLEVDRLCISIVHRMLLSQESQENKLLSTSSLLNIDTMMSICSLLGDTNAELAKQLLASALRRLSDYPAQLDAALDAADVRSRSLSEKCISLSLKSQGAKVSMDKSAAAKVVSLSAKKPSLAEKARAAATAAAAAAATIKQTTVKPASTSIAVEDLQELVGAVCDFSHGLACFTAALQSGSAVAAGKNQSGVRDEDWVTGTQCEKLLIILRRVYEQAITTLVSNKTAYLKQEARRKDDGAILLEIEFKISYAASRLVKAFRSILLAGAASKDRSVSKGVVWPVVFEMLLTAPQPDDAHWMPGALFADSCRVFNKDMMRCIEAMCSDKEQSAYFLDAARCPAGLPFLQSRASASAPKHKLDSASSTSTPVPQPHHNQHQVEHAQSIEAVLSIFSDMGESYAEACLEMFDWDVTRTVDALLSDNLPPSLRAIDRSLKHAWVGKGGPKGGVEVGVVGVSGEKTYSLPDDDVFHRNQRERLLMEERKREEDYIIMAAEYQDDYDDQWDDAREEVALPVASTADMNGAGGRAKVKGKGKDAQTNQSVSQRIQWEVQMTTMKRMNNLIKEKEAEDRFWEEMRNTNHDVGLRRPDGDDGAGVEGKKYPSAAQSQQPSKQSTKAGADGQPKKYRTKTFDKHHAKDKQLRKTQMPL